ncbi:MAG: hypothetical protein IJU71_04525, partial [Selenomonadaceae bacterium]|nr:hypothetical protein [Selenomonadaceae bacterium]
MRQTSKPNATVGAVNLQSQTRRSKATAFKTKRGGRRRQPSKQNAMVEGVRLQSQTRRSKATAFKTKRGGRG